MAKPPDAPQPQPTPRYHPTLAPTPKPDPDPDLTTATTPIGASAVSSADHDVRVSTTTTDAPATIAIGVRTTETTAVNEAIEHPCPHCKAEMVKHADGGLKDGAWHCDSCGGCFVHRGSRWFMREGHPAPDGWTDE